jgi:hypothetical protein
MCDKQKKIKLNEEENKLTRNIIVLNIDNILNILTYSLKLNRKHEFGKERELFILLKLDLLQTTLKF